MKSAFPLLALALLVSACGKEVATLPQEPAPFGSVLGHWEAVAPLKYNGVNAAQCRLTLRLIPTSDSEGVEVDEVSGDCADGRFFSSESVTLRISDVQSSSALETVPEGAMSLVSGKDRAGWLSRANGRMRVQVRDLAFIASAVNDETIVLSRFTYSPGFKSNFSNAELITFKRAQPATVAERWGLPISMSSSTRISTGRADAKFLYCRESHSEDGLGLYGWVGFQRSDFNRADIKDVSFNLYLGRESLKSRIESGYLVVNDGKSVIQMQTRDRSASRIHLEVQTRDFIRARIRLVLKNGREKNGICYFASRL